MKENNKIPDILSSAGKKLPFTLPDNYFETFQGRLQDRMKQQERAGSFTTVIQFLRPRMSYAAIIAGFLVISFFASRQIIQSSRELSLDNFELAEIVDYYLVDYDEELLYESLSELPEEEVINPLEKNSDEIFEYLDTDGIDYSLLIDDN